MSEPLTGRVTLRLSTAHITALEGLVAAGRYPNRSAALRSAVTELLTREARFVETGSQPTRRHLPDGEGASVCGLSDDIELTHLPSGRGETLKLCRGCDPTVDDRRGGADPTGGPTEVSTHGHE